MKQASRKYVPDLSEYMSQCELNYALMLRLFSAYEKQAEVTQSEQPEYLDCRDFEVHMPFHLKIMEQAKYTTTLELRVVLGKTSWISPIKLTVRLYHDAQMAEVLENKRNHAPKAKHSYPQQVKHYPDDKFQRNRLLNQCLTSCLDADSVLPVIVISDELKDTESNSLAKISTSYCKEVE